jgi:Protein of unknown function (DUF3500)
MGLKMILGVFLIGELVSQILASPAMVIEKSLAFKALLNPTQLAKMEQPYSVNLAHKWSNLPVTMAERNGILFLDMTAPQVAAAMQVVMAVMGTAKNQGADEFKQIILADSILAPFHTRYNVGHFAIAFLNTPSLTGDWLLQFSGHHFAANFAFSKGELIGATPQFRGIEPTTYNTAGGTIVKPLGPKKEAFVALLASLSTDELKLAKLASGFGDVTVGAGNDGKFPASKVGIKIGSLTLLQQSKALAAINAYVQDSDPVTAATLIAEYQADLANTYLSYSGAGNFTTTNDYIRLDGPKVWIEFISQAGVNFPNQTHYHSIWRDRARDYGNDLKGQAITTSTHRAKQKINFTMGGVAQGGDLHLNFPTPLNQANLIVRDLAGTVRLRRDGLSGNRVSVNLGGLARGVYAISIEDMRMKLRSDFTIY